MLSARAPAKHVFDHNGLWLQAGCSLLPSEFLPDLCDSIAVSSKDLKKVLRKPPGELVASARPSQENEARLTQNIHFRKQS